MTKETLAFVTEKTKELTAAHSCCAELKEAANNWLAAAGTDKEAEATKAYVAELEADIMPIDGLIAFAESDMGVKIFGAEMAKNVTAHGKEMSFLNKALKTPGTNRPFERDSRCQAFLFFPGCFLFINQPCHTCSNPLGHPKGMPYAIRSQYPA